jgi:hypothetical protein
MMAGQDNVTEAGEGAVYAALTIRQKTQMDPPEFHRFVFVADEDPTTARSYRRYDEAILAAIRVLTSYASGG